MFALVLIVLLGVQHVIRRLPDDSSSDPLRHLVRFQRDR